MYHYDWILSRALTGTRLKFPHKLAYRHPPLSGRLHPEIRTVYGQLGRLLGVEIKPAPDEWDRRYNVDFFIEVNGKFIGIQIKPAGYAYIPQIINELEFQRRTHERFSETYGGKVFYVISVASYSLHPPRLYAPRMDIPSPYELILIMNFEEDTIAAVSTPPGEGGIGIVRLSGKQSIPIAERIFFSPKGKRPSLSPSHTVLYGFIKDPETGENIDEVLLTVMRAPHTYTRQDVVEINCHGGALPLRGVLEIAVKEGARPALPGEFTKRAFLNGRMDLSQAEAVLDLIRARTERAERIAVLQLRGGLSEKINALKDDLTEILVHVEAQIDFPEEELETQSAKEIRSGIGDAKRKITSLIESYSEGRLIREGAKAAIVGRPNVGKSSLLNALLQRERAIVTETPGTTRDVLEEPININGIPLSVMDTAGIRESREMAEKEGVRRSLEAIKDADIVLAVMDGSLPPSEEDKEVVKRLKGKNSILVLNKKDLGIKSPKEFPAGQVMKTIEISAKTGEGIEGLKTAVSESLMKSPAQGWDSGVLLTSLRHKTALEGAKKALLRAEDALENGAPLEIASLELREALSFIGEIVGAVTTEEILGRIFGEFCIGK